MYTAFRVARRRSLWHSETVPTSFNALSRRANASFAPRALRRHDLWAITTTLVFTATIADAAWKGERARIRDRALNDIRAAVESVEADHELRLSKLEQSFNLNETTHSDRSLAETTCSSGWALALDRAIDERRTRRLSGYEQWKGIPLCTLHDMSAFELEYFAQHKQLLRCLYGRHVMSHKYCPETLQEAMSDRKLKQNEWSLLLLTLKIWMDYSQWSHDALYDRSVGQGFSRTHAIQRTSDRCHVLASYSTKRIKILANRSSEYLSTMRRFSNPHQASVPSPQLLKLIPEYANQPERTTYMNTTLKGLLSVCTRKNKSALGNVCAFLLENQTPPNTETYNILLSRFSQMKDQNLFEHVAKAIKASLGQCDETTNLLLLRHYIDTSQGFKFRRHVNRMFGRLGGLALEYSGIGAHHEILSSVYRVRGEREQKLTKIAIMDDDIHNTVVIGFLKLFGAAEAIPYFEQMVATGWSPSMNLLTLILKDCVERQDVASALRAWSWIQELCQQGLTIGASAVQSIRWLIECTRPPLSPPLDATEHIGFQKVDIKS